MTKTAFISIKTDIKKKNLQSWDKFAAIFWQKYVCGEIQLSLKSS